MPAHDDIQPKRLMICTALRLVMIYQACGLDKKEATFDRQKLLPFCERLPKRSRIEVKKPKSSINFFICLPSFGLTDKNNHYMCSSHHFDKQNLHKSQEKQPLVLQRDLFDRTSQAYPLCSLLLCLLCK